LIGVARYLYAAFAWLFLVGVVVQVFFIGLALFAGRQNLDLHVSLGWILHLAPILVLAVAALARAGRPRILMAAALVVVVLIVPILALLRESSPVIAALHPVGATLAFWLAVTVARQSLDRLREAQPTTTVA
jgi:hypothetical protein